MSVIKTAALGILTWWALGTLAEAAPMTWSTQPTNWTSWITGLNSSDITNLGNLPLLPPPPQPFSSPTPLSSPTVSAPVEPTAPVSAPVVTAAAVAAPSPAPSAPATTPVDAFINLGTGPYPNAGTLTTGGAQPWYDSSQITNLFGGVPNAQQQSSFAAAVLQRVEQTFELSGVPVTLTTNPGVPAAHTLSVVSGTSSNGFGGNAIGLTDLSGNGFSFIDQIAKSAQSVDQLESIVAHNVSHELMLAFGVGENYDQTGKYIDSTNANWSMMVSPNATFSPAAAQALNAANFLANSDTNPASAQLLGDSQPVPEPAALLVWAAGAAAAVYLRKRSLRTAAAGR